MTHPMTLITTISKRLSKVYSLITHKKNIQIEVPTVCSSPQRKQDYIDAVYHYLEQNIIIKNH
jgi:hypothetical protein